MFQFAVPVFAEGKETEKNYQLILRAEVEDLRDTVLAITAFSFYRLTVNGTFVSFGPARTAEGYARVDEIPLSAYGHAGKPNEIVIEVAGYYCHSLTTVCQPSFVTAELRRGKEVLLYTGRDFEGYCSCRRLQKTERYSLQRHFGEVWDYTAPDPFASSLRVRLTEASNHPVYLPRRAPMPTFACIAADGFASGGTFRYAEDRPCRSNRYSRFTHNMNPEWGQYYEDEVVHLPFRWIQKQQQTQTLGKGSFPIQVSAGEYVMVDFEQIRAGFLTLSVTAQEDCEAVLGFSELCSPNRFAFTDINCQNVIEYQFPAGKKFETASFEPYTCRVAVLMVRKGSLILHAMGIRTFEFDRSRLLPNRVRDPELRQIRTAAENTFAHNAVDLYSDCPSRERAGWLCDSYFTGKAEYFLTGRTDVEDAFLENYRLCPQNPDLPQGALPECYPSDVRNGEFIPQWNLWYILEVRDYLLQRKPTADKELFRAGVYGVLRFFQAYENRDGLLQDLPSWNFVEWSTANEWVQNVNYPTNFLYAAALQAVGEVYGDDALLKKAAEVQRITREKSFDGEVFIDHAILNADGVLQNTKNSSEAGQYYAILFGGVELKEPQYAKLQHYVRNSFADFNTEGRGFVPVNAFIGLYLRILTLMQMGEKDLLKEDLKSFFGGMVASTGTLWEYKQLKGSHDHGFASLAAIAIDFVENDLQ